MTQIFHESLNKHPIWYQGTNLISAQNIINNGIQFNHRNIKSKLNEQSNKYWTYDFGPGFYLTANKDQAIQWAKSHSNVSLGLKPALLKLNLTTFTHNAPILRFNYFNRYFIKYVLYCRISGFFDSATKQHYSAIFGHVADGNIKKYVYKIRQQYIQSNLNLNAFLKHLNYSDLKTKLKLNKFRKDNQLCLIDNEAIMKYIKIDSYERNLEVL